MVPGPAGEAWASRFPFSRMHAVPRGLLQLTMCNLFPPTWEERVPTLPVKRKEGRVVPGPEPR